VLVNPTDDIKSVGFGAGVGYRLFRFGGGFLFVRHSDLDDQAVDQRLASADELRKRDVYGRRNFFVSFSITGIPPFTVGK